MIDGFDKEKCRRRNRLVSARGKVEGAPIRFLKSYSEPASAFVSQAGELPRTDEDAMAAINARLPDGASPLSRHQVYIHYLEAASNALIPDRHAFFATSTLVNIAKGGQAGVAFMNSHRTGTVSTPAEFPFGRTFAGRYEAYSDDAGNVRERAILGMYMLRGIKPNGDAGPTTDHLEEMINGGALFDVSVGLMAGESGRLLCDVCGSDYKACDHVSGTTRDMSDEEQAVQRTRGVATGKATYTIDDYQLSEVSGVYDGAVPGAGFSKGFSLLAQLSEDEREQFRKAFRELMDDEPTTTISADSGRTGPSGAGKTQVPDTGPGEDKQMKNILVRALTGFGLGRMARAVEGSSSEEPEEMAAIMARQVDAEVTQRASENPILSALEAHGIRTIADVDRVMAAKQLGDQYLTELRADACAEATRAYGDLGPTISAAVADLPAASVKTMRDAWRTEADAKFGTTKSEPAKRQTAPTGAVAVDVEDRGRSDKKPWDQLSPEQQEIGRKMGANTPDKQNAFAKNYLANKETA